MKNWVMSLAAGLALAAVLGVFHPTAEARSWDDVVKAAEQEGEVVVISPPSKPHRETVMQFQKAYPNIKLKLTAMASPQWEPRVTAERKSGLFVWDAIVSGGGFSIFTKHIPGGWYQPVADYVRADIMRDELWLAGWQAGFMDNAGKFTYGFARNISELFLIDRGQIPESELNSLEDLAKPQFKGKIAMYDPRHRGPGGFALAAALSVIGEEKTKTLLGSHEPVLTTTFRQIIEWSVRGRYPIVIGAPLENIIPYQQKGIGQNIKPLQLPANSKPVGPGWGTLMIFDGAPHPNATMVFASWMLGKQAQADWAKRGLKNSRRLDVPAGLKEIAATEEQWTKGLMLSTEKFLPMRLKLVNLARESLKK